MIPPLAAPVNHAADTGPKPRCDPAVFLLSPQIPFHFRSALPLVDGLPCFCFAISATDCRIETPMDAGISPCFLVFSCRILNAAHTLRCSALFCLAPGRMRFGQSPGFFNQNGGIRGKSAGRNRFGVILGSNSKIFKISSENKKKSTLKLPFQRACWLRGQNLNLRPSGYEGRRTFKALSPFVFCLLGL